MSDSRAKNYGFKDRLLAEIRRYPQKASILGVLMVVLLIIVVREVAMRAGSPKTGSAATAQISGQPGEPSLRKPVTASGQTASLPGGLDGSDALAADMPRLPVDRDIFTPKEAYFPVEQQDKPGKVVGATIVDPNARKEAKKREVQAHAQSLSLQSTAVGSVSTAIVNGRVLHVGDWINGFQIVEITSRYCQLEKSGIRVMLEMAN